MDEGLLGTCVQTLTAALAGAALYHPIPTDQEMETQTARGPTHGHPDMGSAHS